MLFEDSINDKQNRRRRKGIFFALRGGDDWLGCAGKCQSRGDSRPIGEGKRCGLGPEGDVVLFPVGCLWLFRGDQW